MIVMKFISDEAECDECKLKTATVSTHYLESTLKFD